MKDFETVELVTRISAVDGRIAPASAAAFAAACDMWHDTIGDLDYDDARAVVVAHYRDSTERLMPADVRLGVAKLRRSRLAALPPVETLMADVDPDDPRYDGILRDRRQAAMDPPTLRAITHATL
jgi:hypothetical protein